MGQFFDEIPDFLIKWIEAQHMFWVATAPLSADGHINVSPKGVEGTFHVLDAHTVWYEDLSGSGAETIAHLRENGRITVLFSAFQGPPRIARLFGTGTVHEFGTPAYDALIPAATRKPGSRAAIVVDVRKVGTSCGYAVPFYAFRAHRTQLLGFFARKEENERAADGAVAENGLRAYWALKNKKSQDGLPALLSADKCPGEFVSENVVYRKDDISELKGAWDGFDMKYWADGKTLAGFSMGLLTAAVIVKLAETLRK